MAKTRRSDLNSPQDDEQDTNDKYLLDVLGILQEYQKKRTSKASSRVAGLEAKQKEVIQASDADVRQIKTDGATYMYRPCCPVCCCLSIFSFASASVKAALEELRSTEVPPDAVFADVAALFGCRIKALESQSNTLSQFLAELSPARVDIIEANSTDLTFHTTQFEKTGKKIKRMAKRELEDGMQNQKLATEVQTYIKHYKQLVKS
ncbi:hypothetical protein M422DRAFT_66981 [Sphaerobolus stellatus SS14]|uniref:Uncharacterized protein n=1 Tax=Sphaerobolus stellatus (strain SS14) TaxID=990650 RepID=A0A0C9W1R2_SPHS4|nr:hypothetical protein M422DRAFT_66981 [Sphaerobolus stellatus SS14]